MVKKFFVRYFRHIPVCALLIVCLWGFIFYPEKIAQGVTRGITLCVETVIPALFPFMVFASCFAKTALFHFISSKADKITQRLFKVSGVGFTSVVLGLLGGYPIGAKGVNDAFSRGLITQNEAARLFCWCSNPSPAFVISAVGVLMLSSYKSGVLLFASTTLSALTIGFFTRFFTDCEKPYNQRALVFRKEKNIFTRSVSETGKSMLGICGWVLTFSAISALSDAIVPEAGARTFLNCIAEVTAACKTAYEENLSLPLIGAILGFGGLGVIFQIYEYMKSCGLKLRVFLCVKLLNGALAAFYCSLMMKLFPQSTTASVTLSIGNQAIQLSHSIATAIILLITCTVFIIEVDNKRKLC